MKTVLFVLIAVLGHNVQGIKVRGIHRRWIQYHPSNQITSPEQMQYYHRVYPNQRPPIYRNGRLIYSYLDPVGMRFNMFGGPEGYKAYLKKYGNLGYQSVDQYGPGYGIRGIAEGQSDNSGYEGLSGPSVYERWQNSASGKPAPIYVGYNGINGYGAQHGQSVYQRWQDSANSRPVDISVGYNAINGYGGDRDQSVYQTLESLGSENPEVSIEQNGIEPGNIDKSLYQSWKNIAPGGQLGVSIEQNGVDSENKGHVEQTFQNLESSASINPIDISVGQSAVSSGHGDSLDQSLYQNLQNPASISPTAVGENELNYGYGQPIDQSLYQSSESPVDVSLEQRETTPVHDSQSLYQSFQNSAPGGIANLPADHNVMIFENKDQPIEFIHHSLQNTGDEGQINLSVGQSVPNFANGGHSPYSLEQNLPTLGQINYLVQQTGQNSENGGQDVLSIAQGETNEDHDINIHNEEDIGPNQHNTENYLSYSIDNKPNWSSVAPLQGILKDVNINDEENISPVGIKTEHYVVSPDNEGIISLDPIKFTDQGPVKDIHQDTHVNGKENDQLVSDNEGDEDLYLEDKLNLAGQIPIKDPVEEIHVPLPYIMANNQDNRAPISIMPENDLISTENEGVNTVDKSELSEVTDRPLEEILDEGDTNNNEDIAPALSALGSAPIAPITDFPSYHLTNLNWVNKAPIVIGESLTTSERNPVPLYPYILNPNQLQSNGYVTTWNHVSRKRQPVVIPYNTPFGNIQWIKPATGNMSPPKENNVFSSVCQNPYVNLLSGSKGTHTGVSVMPLPNIQDIIKNLQTQGIHYYPPNTYKNSETLQNTNGQYQFNNFKRPDGPYVYGDANPNYYENEIFSYKPGNINLNAHNIPPPNHYSSAPSPQGIGIQSEILEPNESSSSPLVFEENKEVKANIPNSELMHIIPKLQQKNPIDYVAEPSQPLSSAFKPFAEFTTGFNKPRHPSPKKSPNQYVYQIQEALEPELMRLYHSKCSTGHDAQLLNEIKKLIDTIQVEHCEIM